MSLDANPPILNSKNSEVERETLLFLNTVSYFRVYWF